MWWRPGMEAKRAAALERWVWASAGEQGGSCNSETQTAPTLAGLAACLLSSPILTFTIKDEKQLLLTTFCEIQSFNITQQYYVMSTLIYFCLKNWMILVVEQTLTFLSSFLNSAVHVTVPEWWNCPGGVLKSMISAVSWKNSRGVAGQVWILLSIAINDCAD